MNRFSLLLGLSVCLLAGTEAALKAEGIIGGMVALPETFKYQISLEIKENGTSFCGGGIIGDQYVLTAAHCVTNKDGDFHTFPKQVVAGVTDLRDVSNAVTVDVEKVYIPSEYRLPIGDIAVLKLKKPLGLDDNEQLDKLELPEVGKSYVGEAAEIAGFGFTSMKIKKLIVNGKGELTEDGGYFDQGTLTHATTAVVSKAECQSDYKKLDKSHNSISDKHICARVKQHEKFARGVCTGDSGSPLVYDNSVVIGVLSSNPFGCSERIAPGVYTRVSAYLDFINDAMADRVTSDMRDYTEQV